MTESDNQLYEILWWQSDKLQRTKKTMRTKMKSSKKPTDKHKILHQSIYPLGQSEMYGGKEMF